MRLLLLRQRELIQLFDQKSELPEGDEGEGADGQGIEHDSTAGERRK